MEASLLLWLSFIAGILAPLASPCVLVLYPGYLVFLAGTFPSPMRLALAGTIITCGVLLSLLAGGIVFSLLLQSAGELFRSAVTTAIYLLLLVLALLLIFGSRPLQALPLPQMIRSASPLTGAFLYGALFGIILLPCNAAALVVLLALAATATGFWAGLGAFLLYGAGLVVPLLALALLSDARSSAVLGFITTRQTAIRIASGIFMLIIALWNLALIAGWIP